MRIQRPLQYIGWYILFIFFVFSCENKIKNGYYTCTPNEPGTCPAGWVCQLRGTDGIYRCYERSETWCGDGVRDALEECDSLDMGDFTCEKGYPLCLGNCKAVCTQCGNGRIELDASGRGEECDDGNTISGDGCSEDCRIERAYCQESGENCLQWCGDGHINGPELCEPNNLAGYSCTDFNYVGGELKCSSDCRQFDFSNCTGYCGNGVIEGFEMCDGMSLPVATCRDYMYTGGTLGCSANCQLSQEHCFSSWERQNINTTGNVMALHETPEGSIVAISFAGWVGLYNGDFWREWQLEKDTMLRTVFAFSETDVWVGGNFGALYHFDGTDWNKNNIAENIHITGIWGAAPNNVYACGFTTDLFSNAVLLHYDGVSWTDVLWMIDPVQSEMFLSMHGKSENDIYVVGRPEIVWHYDGMQWTRVTPPTGMVDFRFVTTIDQTWLFSGYTDTDVGFILQEENGAFTNLPITASSRVIMMRGSSLDTLWVLLENGSILRREPDGFRTISLPVSHRVYSLWQASNDVLWVGSANGVLYRYTGEFETFAHAFPQNITRIWGSKFEDFYVAGQLGALHHLTHGAWQTETPMLGMVVQDLWGPNENLVFAVGNSGTIAVRENGIWTPVNIPHVTAHLRAVHGCSADNVWVVGMNGTVLHYTQGQWIHIIDPLFTETYSDVYCVSFEAVYIVGNNGTILFYNGNVWSQMISGTSENLNAVWASSARNVYAVGNNGVIVFYDGSFWTQWPSGVGMTLRDIDGTHARNIWVAGNGGVMLHYDGVRFSPISVPTSPSLSKVHVQSDRVFAATGSSILEYRYHIALPPHSVGPCPAAVPLYCQETRPFDTTKMLSRVDTWGNVTGFSGPETAFVFRAPFTGQFTWSMQPTSSDARIIVLRDQDFENCNTASVLNFSTRVDFDQVISMHLERNQAVVLVIDSSIPENGKLVVNCIRN